jgi:OOP family OmpA-OmpF porin
MNIKSLNIVTVAISTLLLIGCQTTTSAPPSDIPQIDNIVTLIPDIPDSDGDGVLDDIDNCPKTPINTAVDNNGCPVSVNLMGPVALEIKTYFEQGSAEFSSEGYADDIDRFAEKFAAYRYLPIVILGHVSEREATVIHNSNSNPSNIKKYVNNQLAQDRAQLVKNRLISQGISASKIYAYDCGTHYQIDSNDADKTALMSQRVFGWSAVEDDKYIIQPYGLEGYKEKCRAF